MSIDYGEHHSLNLKTIIVLGRLNKSIEAALSPGITKSGLTVGQFGVLEALYHKGPLSVNEVIAKTLSSSGNMGVVIDNLLKRGLLVKQISPDDKRSRILKITEKGTQKISELFPGHLKAIDTTLSGLSNDEKKQLIELGKKLGKSLL